MKWLFRIMLLVAAPVGPRAFADPEQEPARGVPEEFRGDPAAAEEAGFESVRRAVDARLAAGDRAGAVKLFRELATARPGDLQVQISYADFLMERGRGDTLAEKQALEALQSSLAAHPGNPAAIGRMFDIHFAAGRKEQALALLDRLAPDDPASAVLSASLAAKVRQADAAARRDKMDGHYELALAADPANPELAGEAAEYFRNSGRLSKAIEILERHVEAAPSSLALRTRLGVLYFMAKEDDKGEAELKRVLEIDPNGALAHQSLAKFYKLRNKPDLARFHSGELLKIQGGPAGDFLELADAWLTAGDPRQARLLLEKAVSDHPENRELAVKLAIATHRDPATKAGAARLFREAEAAMRPGEAAPPEFLLEAAESLLDEGQDKAAEARLRDAIRAFPPEAKRETAAALRQLAGLWESQQRDADAAKALRGRADALEK